MNEKIANTITETLKHINEVRKNLFKFVLEFDKRAQLHDLSKLESPELEIFAENTDKLALTPYGGEEYQKLLETVKPAIQHHYSKNRHHPEFHKNGIEDMDLIDLSEMLADWIAATQRNKNGNIRKSIEINAKKHNMSPQLQKIFENTVSRYF